MSTTFKPQIVKDFLLPNDYDTEKCFINNEWWLTKNLIKEAEAQQLQLFDLDLKSIDLGVMPWQCDSILHFLGHMNDVKKCDLKYPVIIAPSGWVMNGWHRISKAIMQGKETVRAARFVELPEPDGIKE